MRQYPFADTPPPPPPILFKYSSTGEPINASCTAYIYAYCTHVNVLCTMYAHICKYVHAEVKYQAQSNQSAGPVRFLIFC
jgi:hypothetical protein